MHWRDEAREARVLYRTYFRALPESLCAAVLFSPFRVGQVRITFACMTQLHPRMLWKPSKVHPLLRVHHRVGPVEEAVLSRVPLLIRQSSRVCTEQLNVTEQPHGRQASDPAEAAACWHLPDPTGGWRRRGCCGSNPCWCAACSPKDVLPRQ
ncbi:unnamed protein product [Scytosiphon promiscuus]